MGSVRSRDELGVKRGHRLQQKYRVIRFETTRNGLDHISKNKHQRKIAATAIVLSYFCAHITKPIYGIR